jgi:hypothetical protein
MMSDKAKWAWFLAGIILAAAPCAAQEAAIPAGQHPWGRFPAGSWKSVRVTTHTLDASGNVASVTCTETRTTLVAVDKSSYSLRVESIVEIAGKRFAAQPQVVKHGYYGQPAGQAVTVQQQGQEELMIDGRTVKSDVHHVSFEGDGGKRTSTIHYSSQVSPFQLRRETKMEGGAEQGRSTTLVETVALGMPQKVLGQWCSAAHLKTTRTSVQGTKVTLEVHCDDVPGGVVSHSATETDASGRTVRRTSLELVDYAIGEPPPSVDPAPRRRLFQRHRLRRMD